jgi:hypothetical protein
MFAWIGRKISGFLISTAVYAIKFLLDFVQSGSLAKAMLILFFSVIGIAAYRFWVWFK